MQIRKTRRWALYTTIAAAVLLAAAILLFGHRPTLVIENLKTGEVIFQRPDCEGLTFSISFRHSVNRSDVEELYQVRGGALYVTGCRYSAFGAGVATEVAPGQSLVYEPGGTMLLSGLDTKLDDLQYVFGTVYDHYLHIDGVTYNLCELGERNMPARVYIR